jgi:O-antigen/teichoic acid export membrane protein
MSKKSDQVLFKTLLLRLLNYSVVGLGSIFTFTLISKTFGLESLGDYFLLITLGQLLSLIDLGVSYGSALISKERNLSQGEQTIYTRTAMKKIARNFPAYIVLCAVGSYFFLDYFLKRTDFDAYLAYSVIVIGSFSICLFSPLYQSWISRGRLEEIVLLDILKAVANFFGILIACLTNEFLILAMAWVISMSLPSLIFFRKDLQALRDAKQHSETREPIKSIESVGIWFQLSSFIGVLGALLPSLLISFFVGNAGVAIFQIILRITSIFKGILGTVWLDLWPRLASEEGLARNLRDVAKYRKVMIAIGLFGGLLFILLTPTMFAHLSNDKHKLEFFTLWAAGTLMFFYSLEIVNSAIVNTSSLLRRKTTLLLVSLLVELLCAIILIPKIGYSGAIVARLLAYGFIYLPILSIKARKRITSSREMFWQF